MFLEILHNWFWITTWAILIPLQMFAALFGLGTFGASLSGPEVTPMFNDHSQSANLFRFVIYSIGALFLLLFLPMFMVVAYEFSLYRVLTGIGWGGNSPDSFIFCILSGGIGMLAGLMTARKLLPAIDHHFGLESKLSGPLEAWMIFGEAYTAVKTVKVGAAIVRKI